MDLVKTLIVVVLFLFLAFGNIANIIRHSKENKEAEEQRKIENFPNAKKLKPRSKDKAKEDDIDEDEELLIAEELLED